MQTNTSLPTSFSTGNVVDSETKPDVHKPLTLAQKRRKAFGRRQDTMQALTPHGPSKTMDLTGTINNMRRLQKWRPVTPKIRMTDSFKSSKSASGQANIN